MRTLSLEIASLWNGEPVASPERATGVVTVASDVLKMVVDAPFYDDPTPPGPPGSAEGLWEYEVVELFVAGSEGSYLELELGPHGHYLVLAFSAPRVRRGGPRPAEATTSRRGSRWHGSLSVETSSLGFEAARVNAYAIHGTGAERRYLAAQAPGGARPDFHRLESFVALGGPG